ncbi:methionyl-tRNA formyltransferase [Flavobacterium jejuense]|uniref:Methionyl-tRNA formyltransferase n=1 Tax=Flavobacterium jejuense TaxID=1544455 RepID=A0ABX0IQR1_9FLAO|nr:methionyl-tRNA formyltransferase [Flavobacterium jejuense]NHN25227.1 methionyl-tRNA formyltransferase [Flavobacterium jejuense]
MEKLKIVFMGTPDFAVGILNTIYNSDYEIVGVITAPDKPAGRGQKINTSAVKEFALEKNLRLLQPTNLKSEDFLTELKSLEANLQVVVAFRMLPEVVWKMPKYGTFNLHASLLPQYRGAAPINWAIINGETKTGVTTFFIDDKIDTGAMILHRETQIKNSETVGELHDRLMHIGSEAVLATLQVISEGNVKTTIQEDVSEIKTAYKLNKENCKIDWNKKGIQIYNLIRGLNPYPAAWTFIKDNDNEWNVKLYDATFEHETHHFKAGQIFTTKKEIKIATHDGYLHISSLQFPGKRKMESRELLNGIQFSENAIAF